MTPVTPPFSASCIDACTECHLACEVCAEACLSLAGLEDCVRACRDCAEVCGLTASFMARESGLSTSILPLCIQAAEECLLQCEACGLAHCLVCADVCRSCATECQRVLEDAIRASAA